jgi:hypothetical protein
MELKIVQQKTITARMVLHTQAPNSYAGCNFVLSNADIPFQPDLITIDNITLTATSTNTNSYLLRSSLVNDDVLFGFLGNPYMVAPNITIKPNKPLSNITFSVSGFGDAGEVPPVSLPMTGLWLLSITMNFIELKK